MKDFIRQVIIQTVQIALINVKNVKIKKIVILVIYNQNNKMDNVIVNKYITVTAKVVMIKNVLNVILQITIFKFVINN